MPRAVHPGDLLLELVAGAAPAWNWQEHLQRQQRGNERGQNGHGAHHRPEGARHQQQQQSRRSSGQPMMKVSMRHGYFKHEVQDQRHAQGEKEGVGLQVAGLEQAQGAAGQLGGAVRPAHGDAGDDPAVEPVGNRGQEIVQPDDRGLVKLVEVEAVPHRARQRAQLLRQRVFGRLRIERVGGGKADEHRQQAERGRQRRVEERRDQLPGQTDALCSTCSAGNCLP